MKFSPTAAAQMYPHLVQVECEAHGTQTRAKVPNHLSGVFGNRDNPNLVCKECVAEASIKYDEAKRELKQRHADEKKARRETLKQSRDDAKQADTDIVAHINNCRESEEAITSTEQSIASARSKLLSKEADLLRLSKQLQTLEDQRGVIQADIAAISAKRADKFDLLEKADKLVHTRYNELQAAIERADHLWASAGKSAKRKRNRANKNAAVRLLRDHNDNLDKKATDALEKLRKA